MHRAATPAQVRSTARVVVPARRVPVVTNVAPARARTVALARSTDHRFARPSPYVVVRHPIRPYPGLFWYRPYWTHWYVHPYWRWTHATVVITVFDYDPNPWDNYWSPPPRAGWMWVAGYAAVWGWVPGHWEPVGAPPTSYDVSWIYVPGYWMGDVYVEGFWRLAERPGYTWVDGYYLDDGSYVPGYWAPLDEAPQAGLVWEAGYWDGEYWVEGFWRPEQRAGYRWVSAWLDDLGIYHAGYWEPLEDRPGMVWIPGWFTGEGWEEGYWVDQAVYDQTDAAGWQPEETWEQEPAESAMPQLDEPPPAIPVQR